MPTNREIYFSLINENNKHLTRLVVKTLLNDANNFEDPNLSLYKHFDEECFNYEKLMDNVNRVRSGEPYQYVLGYANFIDRNFCVDKNVLIPRQETEELVMNAKIIIDKAFKDDAPITIADIGTGSGVIAITLKRYFPNARVFATDIDEKCLEIAKKNAILQGLEVEFLKGNLVDPILKKNLKLDVLISNPPYIEDESTIDEQVFKYEPHSALLAKPCTRYYEEILKHANELVKPDGVLIFEIGEDMEEALMDIAGQYLPGDSIIFSKDIYKKTRFMYIIREG